MAYPAILYRYDELQFAEPFVERGIVSFGAAARYNDSKLSDAQRDNEQRRQLSLKMPGHQLAVAQSGEAHANVISNLFKIEIKFDIKVDGEFLRYHILCLSLQEEPKFYTEFPKTNCLITFHNPGEFHHRLIEALKDQLPDYGRRSQAVYYFDPNAIYAPQSNLELCFAKDKSYEWQNEYRIALFGPLEKATDGRLTLILGSLKDICSLTPKP